MRAGPGGGCALVVSRKDPMIVARHPAAAGLPGTRPIEYPSRKYGLILTRG